MQIISYLQCSDRYPGFRHEKQPFLFFSVSCLSCSDKLCTLEQSLLSSNLSQTSNTVFLLLTQQQICRHGSHFLDFFLPVLLPCDIPTQPEAGFSSGPLFISLNLTMREWKKVFHPVLTNITSIIILIEAPVFLNHTLSTSSGIQDSTSANNIVVYLSEVIPVDSKACK